MNVGVVLGPLAALAACASVAGPPPDTITEISQERDCFGCATATKVVFRRDGTASLETTGKARFGTSDRTSTGRLARSEFDRLASLMISRGFFELREEYRDPSLADGAWVITGAVREGRGQRVTNRNGAGPPELEAVEKAIEAAQAGLAWRPAAP